MNKQTNRGKLLNKSEIPDWILNKDDDIFDIINHDFVPFKEQFPESLYDDIQFWCDNIEEVSVKFNDDNKTTLDVIILSGYNLIFDEYYSERVYAVIRNCLDDYYYRIIKEHLYKKATEQTLHYIHQCIKHHENTILHRGGRTFKDELKWRFGL